jgi:hypothetical protein
MEEERKREEKKMPFIVATYVYAAQTNFFWLYMIKRNDGMGR